MALAVSLWPESLARCSRSQVSSSTTSGRLRSLRTATRSLRRQAVDLALDGEQRIDALDRLDRDRRLVDARQIEELAPRMRPAGRFDDRPRLAVGLIEPVEPRIGVRLHQAGVARQMLLGMLAAAVGASRRTTAAGGSRPPKGRSSRT